MWWGERAHWFVRVSPDRCSGVCWVVGVILELQWRHALLKQKRTLITNGLATLSGTYAIRHSRCLPRFFLRSPLETAFSHTNTAADDHKGKRETDSDIRGNARRRCEAEQKVDWITFEFFFAPLKMKLWRYSRVCTFTSAVMTRLS